MASAVRYLFYHSTLDIALGGNNGNISASPAVPTCAGWTRECSPARWRHKALSHSWGFPVFYNNWSFVITLWHRAALCHELCDTEPLCVTNLPNILGFCGYEVNLHRVIQEDRSMLFGGYTTSNCKENNFIPICMIPYHEWLLKQRCLNLKT